MPRAGYEVFWADGVPVVATPDEIDISNAAEFRQSLLSGAGGRHPVLIVDMSETTFCDSTGLHQLVRARRRAEAAGGEVRLVIRTKPVRRVFAIMGLDLLFRLYSSLDDALAARSGPVCAGTTGPAAASSSTATPVAGNGRAPRSAAGPDAAAAPVPPAAPGEAAQHN